MSPKLRIQHRSNSTRITKVEPILATEMCVRNVSQFSYLPRSGNQEVAQLGFPTQRCEAKAFLLAIQLSPWTGEVSDLEPTRGYTVGRGGPSWGQGLGQRGDCVGSAL